MLFFLANKTQCPYCQWIKPIPKGREIEQTEGELTEFDKEQYKLKLKLETRAARVLCAEHALPCQQWQVNLLECQHIAIFSTCDCLQAIEF